MKADGLFHLPGTAAPERRLQDAVRRKLEVAGHVDPHTGASRKARATTCRACRRPVFSGIDRDYGGIAREADPQPLSADGEAIALLLGLRTLELRWAAVGYVIDMRDHTHIAARPVGSERGMDVVLEHHCTGPPPGLARCAAQALPPAAAAALPIDPPF